MSYNIDIIRKNQHKTSKWAGGTTTELSIYPKNAVYSERNFQWRLSSAKVEIDESTFTSLPGINRIIMIIEGELRLEHEGHHKAVLKAFDQDSFLGDWTTKSFGKVTDFNLMMSQGCSGNLEAFSINKGEFKEVLLHYDTYNKHKVFDITEAFYVVQGKVEIIKENDEKIILNQGDLGLVNINYTERKSVLRLYNCRCEHIKIIRATMFY